MIYVKRKKLLIYGLPIILAIFAADFALGIIAQGKAAKSSQSGLQLSVRSEKGALGHNTVGIDEQCLTSSSGKQFLHFSTLGQWDYTADSKPSCPKPVQALSGRRFDCVGFMYPLQTGNTINDFCLLRSTQTCCYGPRPQFNQYILVEMKEPVKFERLAPVIISGKFFVDPNPDEGFIYRMECDSLSLVGEDEPDIDPVKSAKQAKLPLFDFGPLIGMEKQSKADGVARELLALSGKRVVAAGYCVSRTSSQPPRLILAKEWWDGVAQGQRPTIHNAIAVFPADAQQVPPLWKPLQVFTGTLQVTEDPNRWSRDGIVQLRDAQLGVPGVTKSARSLRTAPFIPLYAKAAILAALLLFTLGKKKRTVTAE